VSDGVVGGWGADQPADKRKQFRHGDANYEMKMMLDTKRRGIRLLCEECGKWTRHIFGGSMEKNLVNIDDFGRAHTVKMSFFYCPECGGYKLISHWS